MGNCFFLCRPIGNYCARTATAGHRKVLRVMKTNGKILEYRSSLLVKDLLVNFSGYGVAVSKEALQHLPPNYELKIGQIYYLHPSSSSVGPVSPAGISPLADTDGTSGIKRIKIIITKKQLQELLAKQVSVEEVLAGLQKGTWDGVDSPTSWRPTLGTILEGSE